MHQTGRNLSGGIQAPQYSMLTPSMRVHKQLELKHTTVGSLPGDSEVIPCFTFNVISYSFHDAMAFRNRSSSSSLSWDPLGLANRSCALGYTHCESSTVGVHSLSFGAGLIPVSWTARLPDRGTAEP